MPDCNQYNKGQHNNQIRLIKTNFSYTRVFEDQLNALRESHVDVYKVDYDELNVKPLHYILLIHNSTCKTS